MRARPPRDEEELVARAEALAGRTLREIARERGFAIPVDPRRSKGWAGQLLELVLGATAASRAEPDFPHLQVELKSLPVDARGRPVESTFVCTAPLDPGALRSWETSWVRRKLRRVLWMPLAEAGEERVVGSPVLWSPTPEEDARLKADFEELAALIADGSLWQIDGRRGQALQLRPKAADGTPSAWALDEDGDWVRETARGFYLRPSFTLAILARYLVLPEGP